MATCEAAPRRECNAPGVPDRGLGKQDVSAKTEKPKPGDTVVSSETVQGRAKLPVIPVVHSATVIEAFSVTGKPDFFNLATELRKAGDEVATGDMGNCERMLSAQAHALDTIFANLARRAAANMGEGYLQASDTYMRLALRAQAQCRATLETLATIKNPPVVFAKQANIAHGHQQVNNAPVAPVAREQTENPQTELLEPPLAKPEWMDARTLRAGIKGNPRPEKQNSP